MSGRPILKLFSQDGVFVISLLTVQHWCVRSTNSGVDKASVLFTVPLFHTKVTFNK